ncbi:hypothetical protein T10_2508 [Trichinella papuae]|uniref:Uncharacterized protein n=1 Tax=Trichinella papuae TaxID=268474 RepID=A0A0V1MI59_9BILA|nr:hypothetical protein T10_2508 [Trichinella papuae]
MLFTILYFVHLNTKLTLIRRRYQANVGLSYRNWIIFAMCFCLLFDVKFEIYLIIVCLETVGVNKLPSSQNDAILIRNIFNCIIAVALLFMISLCLFHTYIYKYV